MVEDTEPEEKKPKRKLRNALLRIFLAVGVVIFIFWLIVAQPMAWTKSPAVRIELDPDKLERHVRMLVETCFPRDSNNTANLDQAAQYIAQEMGRAGAEVETQEFEVHSRSYQNVIGSFGPREGVRIVVGAHYDAYGEFPGADDNASGIAGLIELAHLLQNQPLEKRVDLVAFTLEEPPYFAGPHMGSAIHARALAEAGVALEGMITLEMIGYFRDEPNSQQFPVPLLRLFYPSKGNFIAVAGNLASRRLVSAVKRAMRGAAKIPVHSISAPRALPGLDFSDHRNYWEADYPAVMITDTAFYRNHNYHTEMDTPDSLDYARMSEVVTGLFNAVVALAAPDS